jgi:PiT family inorganic phosphate transporter
MNLLILLGSGAVAVGALSIARRTLDTLGNDLTDLPLTAAIVVAVVASVIVIGLSAIGIPASFVIIATMSIVGLGWGRATRTTTISESIQGSEEPSVSVGALAAEEPGEEMPGIGEENPRDLPSAADLFDPSTTSRVILMQNLVPVISTVGAYITFWTLFQFWW